MQRIFSIADIHGRLDLLDKLLELLYTGYGLDLTKDKLVFTGDYVDRGDDSYGVITRLKALQEAHPENVICLAGNHEWINIMYFTRKSLDDIWLFENNGGPETLESYKKAGFTRMTEDHLRWLANLPFSHEEPGFFFSHAPAPIEATRNILDQGLDLTPDELLWNVPVERKIMKEKQLSRDHGNGVIGVCGHVHALRQGIASPRFYDHYIFGDAGCGCHDDAPLCAIDVNTREVVYAWP